MPYRILIEKLEKVEGQKYPEREEIYAQIVDSIDIPALVEIINKGEKS